VLQNGVKLNEQELKKPGFLTVKKFHPKFEDALLLRYGSEMETLQAIGNY
jgi:hypothetical protein